MGVSGRYLDGAAGPLAVVEFSPADDIPVRFGALHLPAFGDEMNKARHVVAAQARAFAAQGGLSLVLDPRGTGDSAGEFAQADWDGWRGDAATAWSALRKSLPGDMDCMLWGLRLGALLAAELACTRAIAPDVLLLWQPSPSGRQFFNQFLRIAAAQRIEEGTAGVTRAQLRETLAQGRPVDIGGYAIGPALIDGAEAVDFEALPAPDARVIVREVGPAAAAEVLPATQKWVASWRTHGVHVDAATVCAPSFWASLELEDAPALVDEGVGAAALRPAAR